MSKNKQCWNCKKSFPAHYKTCIHCGKGSKKNTMNLTFKDLKLLGKWYRGSHHWGKCENNIKECHELRQKLYRMQNFLYNEKRKQKKGKK